MVARTLFCGFLVNFGCQAGTVGSAPDNGDLRSGDFNTGDSTTAGDWATAGDRFVPGDSIVAGDSAVAGDSTIGGDWVGAVTECNDGIDNDSDGLGDWQLDLGCVDAIDTTEGNAATVALERGWTVFELSPTSRVIYVSSSMGVDGRDGLTPQSAVATLAEAATLVRDGEHDFLLLRRGDVWRDESLGRFKSGRDSDHPLVVASYGDSLERPLLELNGHFINHDGQSRSYLAVVGLSMIAYRMEPGSPDYDGVTSAGIRYVGGGDSLLIEDCRLQFMEITAQSYNTTYSNFSLRRSIILDNWRQNTSNDNSMRPSGIFVSGIDGVLIEENLFDHNGWSGTVPDAGANMFNHNMYIQYSNVGNNVVVRGNIVTRASSHGVHGRPGGLYEDNLFVQNSISLQMGYAGHPLAAGTFAHARNNVILDGKLMDPADSSWPRTAALWGLNLDDLGDGTVTVESNIVAHRLHDGVNVGISNDAAATYIDNIQFDWGGGIGDMADPGWLDPQRSIESYNVSLGGAATLEGFLQNVRERGWHRWPADYTAYAVNAYIRDGFR